MNASVARRPKVPHGSIYSVIFLILQPEIHFPPQQQTVVRKGVCMCKHMCVLA